MTRAIVWCPMTLVLGVAVWTDLRSRIIPNWLVLPFLLVGFGVSAWVLSWRGVMVSLEGMLLGGVVFGAISRMGGMGMGDVKLCAAVGAWIGPGQLFVAMVITALAGGVMALGWAASSGFLGELLKDSGNLLLGMGRSRARLLAGCNGLNCRSRKMPYAPAIAFGTLVSFFCTVK